MVWFTFHKSGKIVDFWSGNTSENSWKKFEVFLGLAATENHARFSFGIATYIQPLEI
jgi:hypothetical protein